MSVVPNLTTTIEPVKTKIDNNGRIELYDKSGYRVPLTEIPDSTYWPDLSIFDPSPEEAEQACLSIYDATVARALRMARKVVDAAMDLGTYLPRALGHRMADLDDALMAVETIATVPDDEDFERWAERLAEFNLDRTDDPLPARAATADELAMIAAGLPVG